VSDHYSDVVTAYDGVEDLDSFAPEALAAYRADLLARTAGEAAFVGRRLPTGAHVLEVGSGNGRLLIALSRAGAMVRGTGLEVAASRTAFAQRWAQDEGLADRLELTTADALEADMPSGVDAAVCVTGAFSYFDAIRPGAAAELLQRLHDALAPGGLLVLELYPHPAWRRLFDAGGDELRLWQELPASDPWRFYLSELTLDRATDVLTHRKTFVHRTDHVVDDSRREHLRLYDEATARASAEAAGFGDVQAFGGWREVPGGPGDEVLVVTARRA